MIIRTTAEWPVVFTLIVFDRQIIDGVDVSPHQTFCAELPILVSNSLQGACSKRAIVDEPDRERTASQCATKSVRELQRCTPLKRGRCRIPVNLAHVRRRVGRDISCPRFGNHSAVAVEAETQRYYHTSSGRVLLRRNPASSQRGKHAADGIQVIRRGIDGLFLGTRVGRAGFRAAEDGQLQGLADGVVDIGYAWLAVENAAIGAVRDARTVPEHATDCGRYPANERRKPRTIPRSRA